MINLRLKSFLILFILIVVTLSSNYIFSEPTSCSNDSDCNECEKCDNEICVPDIFSELSCGDGGCKKCRDGLCSEYRPPYDPCTPSSLCKECDGNGFCVKKFGPGCFCNGDSDCNDSNSTTTDSCRFWKAGAIFGKCISYPPPPCDEPADCETEILGICTEYDCIGGKCLYKTIDDCCESNADCTSSSLCKQDSCDLGSHTCTGSDIENCCESDLDCGDPPSAPGPCDTWGCNESNECANIPKPGCCASDNDCDTETEYCDENEGTCICNGCQPSEDECQEGGDCQDKEGFCIVGSCNDEKKCEYAMREQEHPCCDNDDECGCSMCFFDEEKNEQYCAAKPCDNNEECGSCICVNNKCQEQSEGGWTDSFKGTREYFTGCYCNACCFPKHRCIDHLQWNVPEDTVVDYFVLENIDSQNNSLFSEIVNPPFESPVTFDTNKTKCKKLPRTYKLKYISGEFTSPWEITVVEDV